MLDTTHQHQQYHRHMRARVLESFTTTARARVLETIHQQQQYNHYPP